MGRGREWVSGGGVVVELWGGMGVGVGVSCGEG